MRKTAETFLVLFAVSFNAYSADQTSFLIAGTTFTCEHIWWFENNVSNFKELNVINPFLKWTDADFDEAIKLTETCPSMTAFDSAPYLKKGLTEARSAVVKARERQEQENRDAELQRQSIERTNIEKAASLERDRLRKLALADQARKLSECQETKAYRLYDAGLRVSSDLDQISQLNQQMARERKIASASGVRDLRAERAYGVFVTDARDSLAQDFKDYKALGGKAPSPSTVKVVGSDPCAALEAEPAKLKALQP